MSKTFLICLLISVNLCPQKVEKTIAIVNGEHIFLTEYNKVVTPFIEQYKLLKRDEKIDPKELKELKRKVLDELIDKKLLLQVAKEKKISVTDKEITTGIEQVKKRFETEEDFQRELKRENLTFKEFRENIRKDILVMKLIDREVKSKVPIPEEDEAKTLFEKVKKIIDKKKIESIPKDEEEKLDVLAKLIKRQFSELVKIRQIFIASPKELPRSQRELNKKRIEDIRTRIIKGEDFEEMAKLYSEDFLARERGGDWGYISEMDELIPKEIRKQAFSLDVGAISPIIETEYGYHIIKVEAKVAARKISFEEIKSDLIDFIYQEKTRKALENYIKHLRAKASIKIYEEEID